MAPSWSQITLDGPASPWLSEDDVCALLGVKEDTLKGLIEAGQFPAPLLVSPKHRRWERKCVLWYLWGLELGPRISAGNRGK